MAKTRGNLIAARIFEITKEGEDANTLSVPCMFNPYEYTVTKSNSYAEEPNKGANTPQFEFKKAGPQTLKLSLLFDTYETGEDVSKITANLWKFMEPKQQSRNDKEAPPAVAFEWGVFCFRAVITRMKQKFTLFKKDGTPVRAKVDVTFTQHKDVKDYDHQNPTSGGGPIERVWSVVGGDRLDTIAAAVYGDATKWRRIAEHNDISNPFALRSGLDLTIPEDQ